MAIIIDGKATAKKLRQQVAQQAALLPRKPGLAVILVGEDPASQIYVRNKEKDCALCGFESFETRLPAETTQEALLDKIAQLNADPAVDGILVQLPLPRHIDEHAVLSAIRPDYPTLSWIIFGVEWGLVAFAVVFTAIDHNKYAKLSMVCYLGMGWCIILVLRATLAALGVSGFLWILAGGVAYTVGAVLYGIGHSRHIFHTIFHVFVVAGSLLQAIGILFYAL